MLLINLLAADAPERKLLRQREQWAKYRASEKGKATATAAAQRRKESGRLKQDQLAYRELRGERVRARDRDAKKRERERDPEKLRARHRDWLAADPKNVERNRLNAKAWRDADPDRQRGYDLRKKYGLTVTMFEQLFSFQSKRCACCGSTDTKRWNVDHDHDLEHLGVEMVRGIVCTRCNTVLSLVGDNIDALIVWRDLALRYLSDAEAWIDAPLRSHPVKLRDGVSPKAWQRACLIVMRGERCNVCSAVEPGHNGWCLDHDHGTGRIRGLLCEKCNTALGRLGDTHGDVAASIEMLLTYLTIAARRIASFLRELEVSNSSC